MTNTTAPAPEKTITVERNRYGYKINGEFLRRVTTLCGGIPKPWLGGWAAKTVAEFAVDHQDAWVSLGRTDAVKLLKGSPWSKRDDAGDRGSAVHDAIEAFARGRKVPEGVLTTDDERAYFEAAKRFLEEMDPKILGVEVTVFHPGSGKLPGYAGTFDLYAEWKGGKRWLFDWKTGKDAYNEATVQLTAYKHAPYVAAKKQPAGRDDEEKWTAQVKEWGPDMVDEMGVVHVTPEAATLHPVKDSDRLWDVFRAAALVKLWKLDTDSSFGKEPRERVYRDPLLTVHTDTDTDTEEDS